MATRLMVMQLMLHCLPVSMYSKPIQPQQQPWLLCKPTLTKTRPTPTQPIPRYQRGLMCLRLTPQQLQQLQPSKLM